VDKEQEQEKERTELKEWFEKGGNQWPHPKMPNGMDNLKAYLSRNFMVETARDFIDYAPIDQILKFNAATNDTVRGELFKSMSQMEVTIQGWKKAAKK
jgi:hypothetical protein